MGSPAPSSTPWSLVSPRELGGDGRGRAEPDCSSGWPRPACGSSTTATCPWCGGGLTLTSAVPHNLQDVLGVLRKTSGRVGEILADGRIPLVLGGECRVSIAVMSAFRDSGIEPALLYMDGGIDLFTPATNPTGILGSMGVAHLLDEPGTAAELAGLGPARPLLRDDRLLLFGYTDYPGAEYEVLVRRDLAGLPAERIRGRPEQAAEEALARTSQAEA